MREESVRLLAMGLLLAGCSPATSSIAVSVVTDLEPGGDFVGVEVEVFSGAERVGHHEAIVAPGDWTRPTPVTDLLALPRGPARVVVTLYAARREIVVTQAVMLELETHHAIAIVLASSCVRVHCPGDGDPADATTCVGGRCVSPECGADCVTCTSDAECPPSDVCGDGRCVEGTCIYPDGVVACPEGEACHPTRGCVSASCECDDADPCTVDLCEGTRCIYEPRDGVPCDDGVFCNGDDACVGGACVNEGPPPCALASCDEAARTCVVGCDSTADCPGDVVGDWDECVFADECAESGERARMVTSFACVDRRCTPQATMETEPCARATEGMACGDGSSCGEWLGCRYGSCATSGIEPRICSNERCVAGACARDTYTEERSCTRGSQDGATCNVEFCSGTCMGGSCGSLCAYCDGVCTLTGCYRRDGGGRCP